MSSARCTMHNCESSVVIREIVLTYDLINEVSPDCLEWARTMMSIFADSEHP